LLCALILGRLSLAACQAPEPSAEPSATADPAAASSRSPAASLVNGDHLSFIDAGIPAIFIYRSEDPHYHSESDRTEFVEPQLLEEAAKLALLALAVLASP